MAGPIATERQVDEIRWALQPASWPSSVRQRSLVVEQPPTIADDLLADLVKHL